MNTAEDLFKSITGFDEVDVNLLEGVHTTFNSLSSRFEISLDDNRNTSYPFEYCWQKAVDSKSPKSDKSGNEEDSDEDEFDEMWEHSIKVKNVDTAADFANEVTVPEKNVEGTSRDLIIDKKVNFANEIEVIIPKSKNTISGIDKKS